MISDDDSLVQGLTPDVLAIKSLLSRLGQSIHLMGVSQHNGSVSGQFFGGDIDAACQFAINLNRARNGVYFTPNEPHPDCGHKPAKSQIVRIRTAHVDIDGYKPGARFDKDSAHKVVLADLPTLVIDSGNGIHAYWELAKPVDATDENVATVETINRALVKRYGGDPAATNVDRVLRVPGTINWPNAKKRALGCVPCMASILS